MSGIEATGIALAILPLLINQLDNYVQGIETLGDFRTRRYRRKLDYYASHLGSQQASFINTLERSLEGIIKFGDGIHGFESDKLKALWEKPNVQSLLEEKLGRNYVPFVQTMNQLSTLLEQLHRKLGWDKMPVERFWTDSSAFNREVRKFKDLFSRTIYEKIFDQINTANAHLSNLVEQSDYSRRLQKRTKSKHSLTWLKHNRSIAKSLHKAILNDNYWRCACRDQHMIHFLLDVQSPEDGKMIEKPTTRFRLIVASPGPFEYSINSGKAHELEAEPNHAPPSSTTLEAQSVQVRSPRSYTQFEERTMNVAYLAREGNTTTISTDPATRPAISDMCMTLSTATRQAHLMGRELLGYLTDGAQLHSMYYLRDIAEDAKPRSLEDVLASSSTIIQAQMRGAFFFSPKDRLSLAVELAYSVLRLHGSWLKSPWRARDIMFIGKPTSGVGRPALSLSIARAETSTMCREAAKSALIRNEILFPLGLVLIELSLCRPIELLRTAEDHDDNEAVSNLKTATRLLRYVEPSSGHLYGDAVEQCLFGRWKAEHTLEDETMQEEIYQRVVSPLAENLKNFVRGL
ncbi:unnamed protein product [Penicillium bialowiezense]